MSCAEERRAHCHIGYDPAKEKYSLPIHLASYALCHPNSRRTLDRFTRCLSLSARNHRGICHCGRYVRAHGKSRIPECRFSKNHVWHDRHSLGRAIAFERFIALQIPRSRVKPDALRSSPPPIILTARPEYPGWMWGWEWLD